MTPNASVAVIGDGPAGAAAAGACHRAGLHTVIVGPGEPWTATYGTWVDDVVGLDGLALPALVFEHIADEVLVGRDSLVTAERAYGTFEREALRAELLDGVEVVRGRADDVVESDDSVTVGVDTGDPVQADWVVRAVGAPGADPPAWQTAYGVFVDEADLAPLGLGGATVLMDWGWSSKQIGPAFGYVVRVGGRWLVEHTVLAASPAVEPDRLRAGLVDRLGADVVEAAEATGSVETVRIPMGLPPVTNGGRIVEFGVGAGLGHPATGYSVAASIRTAPRLAAAIAAGDDPHRAVWPSSARKARVMHDYGLEALLRLDPTSLGSFFETFFALDVETWTPYLRVDTGPEAIANVMLQVFRRSPWSVRRRLASGNVGGLVKLLRP